MSYIDGFVAAVPTANRAAYAEHARDAAKLFRSLGATQVVETWGDDVPDGELTSFPMAVRCKEDEAVVFSWVVWPDKATRIAAWEKMTGDPAMQPGDMPFDGKRLIYGGFETLLES